MVFGSALYVGRTFGCMTDYFGEVLQVTALNAQLQLAR